MEIDNKEKKDDSVGEPVESEDVVEVEESAEDVSQSAEEEAGQPEAEENAVEEPEEEEPKAEVKPVEEVVEEEKPATDDPEPSAKWFFYSILIIIIVIALIGSMRLLFDDQQDTGQITTQFVADTKYRVIPGQIENRTSYEYNGFDFTKTGRMWFTTATQGNTEYDVEFYYSPTDIEHIDFRLNFDEILNSKDMYITFNPTDENMTFIALSVSQFDTSMLKAFDKRLIPACAYNETDACKNVPIINCENTDGLPVVYFNESEEPSVTVDGNCVLIEGKGWGMLQATERFLMYAYGITG